MENDVTPTRRHVVTAGAAATLGLATAAALTACSGSSGTPATAAPTTAAPPPPGGSGSGENSRPLSVLSAIPVGGAIAAEGADGKPILVTQPEAGKVKAFSAICPHDHCRVQPADKKLFCSCHNSSFDLATGEVTGGPAPSPLPAVAVKVDGGNVVAG